MAIISLITDFGVQDEYVALMKAVILGIDPAAVLVDVSHAVDAQDIVQAAFLLEASYRYFPPGSIHRTVVDPGVGRHAGGRPAIKLRHCGRILCYLRPGARQAEPVQ